MSKSKVESNLRHRTHIVRYEAPHFEPYDAESMQEQLIEDIVKTYEEGDISTGVAEELLLEFDVNLEDLIDVEFDTSCRWIS